MNLDRSRGFGVDSLKSSRPVEFEVKTPEEAEEMFDVLTYQKGSTVLRMFETFIGEETFKDGVRKYLKNMSIKIHILLTFGTNLQVQVLITLVKFFLHGYNKKGIQL